MAEGAARRRPGRRPGLADTRNEIIAAARKVFADKGFDKATIRGIAREAGVDPALVHHYFSTKEGIFVAALNLPADPSEVLPLVLQGPREQVGERLVRFLLTLMADPAAREPMLALVRSATTNEQVAAMAREFLARAILDTVVETLDVPMIRMEAVFAQMFGVIMLRYVLRAEPIASADIEELVDLLAPTIQRYLGER